VPGRAGTSAGTLKSAAFGRLLRPTMSFTLVYVLLAIGIPIVTFLVCLIPDKLGH
jgi:hypothetical protein